VGGVRFLANKRVLKPRGVFWLNVGDTYLRNRLLLVPHRVAIALQDDWICRQEIILQVPNRAPESTTNRFFRNHEHLYMLVKQEDYFFDLDAVREPAISAPGREVRYGRGWRQRSAALVSDGTRTPRSVWSIPYEGSRDDHQCPFPKELVRRLLLSSCPVGGVCLDPFAGIGTTGLVALGHARKAILIEASEEYCRIARQRIEAELEPYKAEQGMSLEAGGAGRPPNPSSLGHPAHYPGRPADFAAEPEAELIQFRHAEDDHPEGG
jgi:DNA modification methylase